MAVKLVLSYPNEEAEILKEFERKYPDTFKGRIKEFIRNEVEKKEHIKEVEEVKPIGMAKFLMIEE